MSGEPFAVNWRVHHRSKTVSTNLDARRGTPGDVFTADFQSAGRGRLDHRWQSPPGTNLLMSAVLGVGGLSPETVSTLPLVVGLAVLRAISGFGLSGSVKLKWPNDILVNGRKICGILCERVGDNVIAGIGINVKRQDFPPEIANRATSLESSLHGDRPRKDGDSPQKDGDSPRKDGDRPRDFGDRPRDFGDRPLEIGEVRGRVLDELGRLFEKFRSEGFGTICRSLQEVDCLRGCMLAVRQTDDDAEPVTGICGGIQDDGSLLVGGRRIYAGEAHVERFSAE